MAPPNLASKIFSGVSILSSGQALSIVNCNTGEGVLKIDVSDRTSTFGGTIKVDNIITDTININTSADLIGVINVKHHGAIGDGVTDDTAALQAIFNTYTGTTNGKIIYFPEGSYLISAGLTVATRNLFIQGAGTESTFIKIAKSDEPYALRFGTVSFVKGYMRDITIQQTVAPTVETHGIELNDAAQFYVSEIVIKGFSKCLVLNPGDGNRVAYCSFYDVLFQPGGDAPGDSAGISFEVSHPNGFVNQNNFWGGRILHSSDVDYGILLNDGEFYNANHFQYMTLENAFNVAAVKLGDTTVSNVIFGCRFENVGTGIIDTGLGNAYYDYQHLHTQINTFSPFSRREMRNDSLTTSITPNKKCLTVSRTGSQINPNEYVLHLEDQASTVGDAYVLSLLGTRSTGTLLRALTGANVRFQVNSDGSMAGSTGIQTFTSGGVADGGSVGSIVRDTNTATGLVGTYAPLFIRLT